MSDNGSTPLATPPANRPSPAANPSDADPDDGTAWRAGTDGVEVRDESDKLPGHATYGPEHKSVVVVDDDDDDESNNNSGEGHPA